MSPTSYRLLNHKPARSLPAPGGRLAAVAARQAQSQVATGHLAGLHSLLRDRVAPRWRSQVQGSALQTSQVPAH